MTNDTNVILENYDSDNINNIRVALDYERKQGMNIHKVYTLVQDNAPCNVIIKKSSREKCVKALLK